MEGVLKIYICEFFYLLKIKFQVKYTTALNVNP